MPTPPSPSPGTVTRFVNGMGLPVDSDADRRVYEQLRAIAAEHLRRERGRDRRGLDTTVLVHEAWIRMAASGEVGNGAGGEGSEGPAWNSRAHFFASAARAMRRILVDRARRRSASPLALGSRAGTALGADASDPTDMLALNEALSKLERHDPRAAAVVSLRYFAGLDLPGVAECMDLSLRTTEREWAYARAWLLGRMTDPRDGDEP